MRLLGHVVVLFAVLAQPTSFGCSVGGYRGCRLLHTTSLALSDAIVMCQGTFGVRQPVAGFGYASCGSCAGRDGRAPRETGSERIPSLYTPLGGSSRASEGRCSFPDRRAQVDAPYLP